MIGDEENQVVELDEDDDTLFKDLEESDPLL